MKLLRLFIILSVIAIVFTGCSVLSNDASNKIATPMNKSIPLQGKWIVENSSGSGNVKTETDSNLQGGIFEIKGNTITFDGSTWEKVNFKIKKVKTDEYFLHKYPDAVNNFKIEDKEIKVIIASSQDKYIYEFVLLNNNKILVDINSKFYQLMNVPEGYTVAQYSKKRIDYSTNIANYNKVKSVKSGLLLGVRIPEQMSQKGTDNKLEQFIYKTYWISFTNNKVDSLLSANDIFLPRKDGFWKIAPLKTLGNEGLEDMFFAKRMAGDKLIKRPAVHQEAKKSLRMETRMSRTILYVGNDYICTENTEEIIKSDASGTTVKKYLRTMPVDNINNTNGIKISDVMGDNGNIALEAAITGVLSSLNNNTIKNINEENQEENFALFRKMGHWFFKGRVSLASDEPLSYMDFNLNLIPPADMVAYDILHVPWTIIKDKVPQAIDAYTSPNNDMAVVLTRNSVLIYMIKNGNLEGDPIRTFSIVDGSAVVMAEWATGDYVQNWEKSFLSNNQISQNMN